MICKINFNHAPDAKTTTIPKTVHKDLTHRKFNMEELFLKQLGLAREKITVECKVPSFTFAQLPREPRQKFAITFKGVINMDAKTKEDAIKQAHLVLNEYAEMDVEFTEVDEGVCVYCDGLGEVPCDESDMEGHIMSGVGSMRCVCQETYEPPEYEPDL